ncbi:hypothetical protein BX286_4449 [Streptomyces sp. 3211.6]|nr:hypothetical protein BX286_4449 [Streptomyces sp. 3211.6]
MRLQLRVRTLLRARVRLRLRGLVVVGGLLAFGVRRAAGGGSVPGGVRAAVRVRVLLRQVGPGRRQLRDDHRAPYPALLRHLLGGRARAGPVGGDRPGAGRGHGLVTAPRGPGGGCGRGRGLGLGLAVREDVVGVARPRVVPGRHQRGVHGLPGRGGGVRALVAELPGRHRVVAAQGVLGGAGGEPGEDDAAVLAYQHGPDRDVAVRPPVRVQHAQRGQHVRGHLRRPVRVHRLVGDQRGQRPGGDEFAHYPQRAVLGEHVEDLVQAGMVRYGGGGLGRGYRPPNGGEFPGGGRRRTGAVEQFGVHDLRQRHVPDEDFLPAAGVEGAGLQQFVLVGRRQRQTVAVGQDPAGVVLHFASPECGGFPLAPADTIRGPGRPRPGLARAISPTAGRCRRRCCGSACTRGRPTGRPGS